MSELKNNIKKSTNWIIARILIGSFVGFFITAYIVRKLPIYEFGIYNLLFSLLIYSSLFASFGLPQLFQRFVPEYYQKEQFSKLKIFIKKGLIICLASSFIFVGSIFIFSDDISYLINADGWSGYFNIFGFGIIFFLEINLVNLALNGMFLHKYSVMGQIFWALFRGVVITLVLNKGWGLMGVIWAEVIAWGGWLCVVFFFYWLKFSRVYKIKDKETLPYRRFFAFGGYSFFNEVGSSILSVATDYFVISIFLGPVAVGIYGFCDRVLRMFERCLPHLVLRDIINPAFISRYVQSKDDIHLSQMFNFLTKMGAFFLFPFTVGIYVLGDAMIAYVFDVKYLNAFIPLCIMASFIAVNVFMHPIGLVLQAIEKVNVLFYSKIFAIYNLVGDLLVVDRYGIVGISLVTGTSVLFKNIFCLYYARKFSNLRIEWLNYFKIILNSTFLGLILFSMKIYVTSILSLIIVLLFGNLLYLLLSVFNRCFSEYERNVVNEIIGKKIFLF